VNQPKNDYYNKAGSPALLSLLLNRVHRNYAYQMRIKYYPLVIALFACSSQHELKPKVDKTIPLCASGIAGPPSPISELSFTYDSLKPFKRSRTEVRSIDF
jgi:hypothetical protein